MLERRTEVRAGWAQIGLVDMARALPVNYSGITAELEDATIPKLDNHQHYARHAPIVHTTTLAAS